VLARGNLTTPRSSNTRRAKARDGPWAPTGLHRGVAENLRPFTHIKHLILTRPIGLGGGVHKEVMSR